MKPIVRITGNTNEHRMVIEILRNDGDYSETLCVNGWLFKDEECVATYSRPIVYIHSVKEDALNVYHELKRAAMVSNAGSKEKWLYMQVKGLFNDSLFYEPPLIEKLYEQNQQTESGDH